jgi:hypothetical protein
MDDRPVKKVSEGWIKSLFVLAFVRAAFTLLIVLFQVQVEILIDVAILTVLGVAAMRRHLWAGYGLIVYSGIDALAKLASGAIVYGAVGSVWVALFTVGTIHLFRSKQFASPIRLDFAFVFRWAVLVVLIGVLDGFILGIIKGVTQASVSPGLSLGMHVLAYALILCSQTVAARRKPTWPLEHILCAAMVATLIAGVGDLAVGGSFVRTIGASLYTFVLTFVAWGIALKLLKARSGPGLTSGKELNRNFVMQDLTESRT